MFDTSSRWIPTLLVLVVPLAVVPGTFSPFQVGKWFLVCVGIPLGLAAVSAAGRLRWPQRNWFLPWIVVNVLATVFGVAPWMSVAGSPYRNAGLIALALGVGAYVIGASVGSDPAAQRMVLRAAFISGAIVGLLATLEWLGVDLLAYGDLADTTRARSTWGTATFAGTHLALVLPIAFVHLRSRDRLWRTVAAVCTVLITLGLVVTGTRGSWIATLVAAAIIVPRWVASSRDREGSDRDRVDSDGAERGRPVLWIVLALVAIVIIVVVAVPSLGRSSGVGRIDQMRVALPVVADRPILGSGPDTQRIVLPSGIDESFEVDHASTVLHDRVHNLVLDTAVTTGTIGVVALGVMLFGLGRVIVRGTRGQLVPTAIGASLAGYLVSLLFAFPDPLVDPIAWILAGLVITATSVGGGGVDGDTDHVEAVRSGGLPPRWAMIVPAVVFLLLAVVGGVWSGGEVVADVRLDDAIGRGTDMSLKATAGGPDPRVAFDRLRSASAAAPARFDIDQNAARILTTGITDGWIAPDDPRVGFAFDGLDRAERIVGRDPDVMMDRAELLTALMRPDEAIVLYDEILEAYPNSFRAHLGLGVARATAGNTSAAAESWERASLLGPRDARAEINLGYLRARLGDPDAAMEHFREALRRDPDNPAARQGLDGITDPEGEPSGSGD